MSKIGIKIEGLEDLIDEISEVEEDITPALVKATEQSARAVLSIMQGNTPVDKGALKASEEIIISNGGLRAEIGPEESKAPYALFVELGHHTRSGSFVQGQFYVERTAIESVSVVEEIFRQALNSLL